MFVCSYPQFLFWLLCVSQKLEMHLAEEMNMKDNVKNGFMLHFRTKNYYNLWLWLTFTSRLSPV